MKSLYQSFLTYAIYSFDKIAIYMAFLYGISYRFLSNHAELDANT